LTGCYPNRNNQLQAVVTGDGRWKLQLPHTYNTLGGRPGGRGGTPVPYAQRKLERAELYDLERDVSEATDVAAGHPDVVARLEAEAERARGELGDALTQRVGKGTRPPGRS
jgi:arylsulfatase